MQCSAQQREVVCGRGRVVWKGVVVAGGGGSGGKVCARGWGRANVCGVCGRRW